MSGGKNILKGNIIDQIRTQARRRKLATRWTKHDQEMLEFYSQFASPGELVFDVGANVGSRTKIFLKMGMKVVAFEPQNECINLLKIFSEKNKDLTIVQKVLGSSEGEAELMISNSHTISSLSPDWINAVKSSGRFAGSSWDDKMTVPMTTLNQMIEIYGIPAFIKIDVEGFEHEVLSGLSKPVNNISLEFTPEFMNSTFTCIEHLESLGEVLFNYSIGESMQFALDSYVPPQEIKNILNGFRHDKKVFGDVYCQFKSV